MGSVGGRVVTPAQADAVIAAIAQCAIACERIATALELPVGSTVPITPIDQRAIPIHAVPLEYCPHPDKARRTFDNDDEWECTAIFHGERCGFRSPALVASGG